MAFDYGKKIMKSEWSLLAATIFNIITSLVIYMLARLIFVAVNWDLFATTLNAAKALEMAKGGIMFDLSAVMYTLAIYIIMMLFPLHLKETVLWHKIAKWTWVVINTICLIINLMDCVYFRYTLRRTTSTVFNEFANEHNLTQVFLTEAVNHWYLIVIAVIMVWAMAKLYVMPRLEKKSLSLKRYYIIVPLSLIAMVPAVVGGMRGGLAHAVRPITVSNANQYVDRPQDAAIVLNTPFSIMRTLGKNVFEEPHYFENEGQLAAVYTPIHQSDTTAAMKKKNVVIIIIESFGKEYIGAFNRHLDNNTYKGFTPFTDSLISKSLTFKYSFANGRKSIDAMPSALSSIPMMIEPFFLTPASMNDLSGIARILGDEGYQSSFFHGAQNGSMGFQAFARATGYQKYYGRTEFNEDSDFDGDRDFDGMWAIWDEPFLQYTAKHIGDMRQPFVATVFTASSHHPFKVPEKYKDVYTDDGIQPIHKCVRYTDMALRRFFEKASHEPWFNNTLFVIVADHTNQATHDIYLTDLGVYSIPIIFYSPDGSLSAEIRDDVIAQQASIMPTVLGILGYNKPYLAFGCDLLGDSPGETWAFNYNNGVYQMIKGDYLLQFDGTKSTGLYKFKTDSLLKDNLVNKGIKEQADIERQLKALIQQYMSRMNNNRLIAGK